MGIDIEKTKKNIQSLRYSLLTRHHYLLLPSVLISKYYQSNEDLVSDTLFQNIWNDDFDFSLNPELTENKETWRLPRRIYMQDICLYYIINEIKNYNTKNSYLFYDKDLKFRYLKECCDLYKLLNQKDVSSILSIKKSKKCLINERPVIKTDFIKFSNDSTKSLCVGLTNMNVQLEDINTAINSKSNVSREKRDNHFQIINTAAKENVDLLLLPENSVPLDWLHQYADVSSRQERAFILGLEHFTVKNFCFNFSVGILPFLVNNTKEAFILPRIKNHYSPSESFEIEQISKKIPISSCKFYHHITWKGICFTIYNCYELTDVTHRAIFNAELDILFAIEYNKDTNYFSNIVEATSRDLHCYFVQANTAEYGDSRIVEPRETIKMNPVRVKGGKNNVIIKYNLDIEELRVFQNKRLPYQIKDKTFKNTPPNYNHEEVMKRGR